MSRKEGVPRRFRSLPQPDLWKEFDRQEAQREFERNPLPLPEVGDEVYIPDPPLAILRKVQTGGRTTVRRVIPGEIKEDGPHAIVKVTRGPEMYYEWYGRRGIGWQQGLLKDKFGNTQAGKKI